jgi:hypothetical protein
MITLFSGLCETEPPCARGKAPGARGGPAIGAPYVAKPPPDAKFPLRGAAARTGRGSPAQFPQKSPGMNPFRLRPLAALACLLSTLALSRLAMAAPEPVSFPGPDGITLRALLLLPEGGRKGVPVIALHGCGGLGGPDRPDRESVV